jgi:hypothetical protein
MLQPDVDAASAFVAALTGTDGRRTLMTWQVLDDTPMARPTYAQVVNGSLEDVLPDLVWLNQRGAGIFVTIQQTNLRSRKWEDIVAARAVFTDADTPVKRPYELPPSIIVQSLRGPHAYWKVVGADLADIPDAQRQLAAYYGTDSAISDIARCMRVPGFFHCKREPFPVQLVQADRARTYTLAEVLGAHPVPVVPHVCHVPAAARLNTTAFAAWAQRKEVAPGRRNHNAYVIAAEGLGRGLRSDEVAAVVADYCERAGIPEEAHAILQSAFRRHERQPFTTWSGR